MDMFTNNNNNNKNTTTTNNNNDTGKKKKKKQKRFLKVPFFPNFKGPIVYQFSELYIRLQTPAKQVHVTNYVMLLYIALHLQPPAINSGF